jgi:sulfate-transporting ATPase
LTQSGFALAGGFSDYEENRKKRTGGDIVPHRIKYRKLVRG